MKLKAIHMLVLTSFLLVAGCGEKGTNPGEDELPPGVLRVTFTLSDSLGDSLVGVLDVDEIENRISMENAASLDSLVMVSEKGVDVWAEGDFEGVGDTVIILYSENVYSWDPNLPPRKLLWAINMLLWGPHLAIVLNTGAGEEVSEKIYAFVLDTDNDNSGVANVYFKRGFGEGTRIDTLTVDASVNTIILDKAAYLDSLPSVTSSSWIDVRVDGSFSLGPWPYEVLIMWHTFVGERYRANTIGPQVISWGYGPRVGNPPSSEIVERTYVFVPYFP